jgi:hypothetical protein
MVKSAPYRHIGGMVITDHGPLTLAAARDLAQFYGREAAGSTERRDRPWEEVCGRRAFVLAGAAKAAADWRRAAGWIDPDAAD